MSTSRVHQLNQTISELRVRGLAERMEIRTLRAEKARLQNEVDALLQQVEHLQGVVLQNLQAAPAPYQRDVDVMCHDGRQYEALSVAAAVQGYRYAEKD